MLYSIEENNLCVMESYDARLNEYKYVYALKLSLDSSVQHRFSNSFNSNLCIISKENLNSYDDEDLFYSELRDVMWDNDSSFIYEENLEVSDLEIDSVEVYKIIIESRNQLFLFPEALLMIRNLDELDNFWLYENSEFVFV